MMVAGKYRGNEYVGPGTRHLVEVRHEGETIRAVVAGGALLGLAHQGKGGPQSDMHTIKIANRTHEFTPIDKSHPHYGELNRLALEKLALSQQAAAQGKRDFDMGRYASKIVESGARQKQRKNRGNPNSYADDAE